MNFNLDKRRLSAEPPRPSTNQLVIDPNGASVLNRHLDQAMTNVLVITELIDKNYCKQREDILPSDMEQIHLLAKALNEISNRLVKLVRAWEEITDKSTDSNAVVKVTMSLLTTNDSVQTAMLAYNRFVRNNFADNREEKNDFNIPEVEIPEVEDTEQDIADMEAFLRDIGDVRDLDKRHSDLPKSGGDEFDEFSEISNRFKKASVNSQRPLPEIPMEKMKFENPITEHENAPPLPPFQSRRKSNILLPSVPDGVNTTSRPLPSLPTSNGRKNSTGQKSGNGGFYKNYDL